MDWGLRYARTVEYFESRVPPTTGHFHHIIPRAWGGSDEKTNLVKVTVREHLHLHLLLAKIDQAQAFAVIMLCNQLRVNSPKWVRRVINNTRAARSRPSAGISYFKKPSKTGHTVTKSKKAI